LGFVALLLGAFDALIAMPGFAPLAAPAGAVPADEPPPSNGRWWTAFWLSALIPVLTYYPALALGGTVVKP
ncbi:hypothetical protein, partial [Klebsiella pneumoniae]|uniref:hypothetical protein n=1 Tax=Klebsiella pneumoniae TaxID=573 RepID=UPI0037122EA3